MVVLPVADTDQVYYVSPSKIIALGLNYADHIQESVSAKARGITGNIPKEPVLFAKTSNVLIGPDEVIIIPKYIREYAFENPRVDYEAELALIIKEQCKNVPAEEAMDYVFGYTCMNDVSQRNFQNSDASGWFRGKSLDTFGPIGPVVVLAEDIGDPQNLRIQTRLNGRIVQDSNTRHMIFTIPEIIAFISRQITLLPGDIIMTGTPQGVGPIKDGDTVEIEIENIGVLSNPVREE